MSVLWVGAAVAAVGVGVTAYDANKASKAQTSAANQANSTAQDQYNTTRNDQAPYRTAGYSALSRMSDLLGLSGNTAADGYGSLAKPLSVSDVQSDPGYQFGLTQGVNTAQNSAAAKGGLYSGATLKALSQYGTDYATTKYDDAFNRLQSQRSTEYNQLAGIAGTGQTATNTVDSAGASVASNVGANLIGAGNARGAADLATGNALTNGLNQAGAWWLRSNTPSSNYQTPTQFQDGTTLYGGSGSTLYGDGYGPE